LEFLLNKIDSELFSVKSNDLIDNALEAMVDFFNIGAVLRSQISPQAIELFLKEKNLTVYLLRLQSALGKSPKIKYEIDELKKFIFTAVPPDDQRTEASVSELTSSEDESSNKTGIADVSEELKSGINTVVEENLLPESPSAGETEEIELDDFEIINPNVNETINLSDEIKIEEETETFPLDAEEFEESSPKKSIDESTSQRKSEKDILSFLSDREVEKIIGSIFNEDKEDFATTIETISECKTYEKATEILKSLYTTYNVNPYSHDAILLTNAVAKFFTIA